MGTSRPANFLAFLNEIRQQQEGGAASGRDIFSLLYLLADSARQALPVGVLMGASKMGFNEYSDALKRLQAGGFIVLSGAHGEEEVRLTEQGANVASTARTP